MKSKQTPRRTTYHIRVEGTLIRAIADCFSDITITPQENGETLFTGQFADQSALRGFLDQLWNLNFTILALERIENETTFGRAKRVSSTLSEGFT